MATKLHELLSVSNNYQNQAGKLRAELMKTFNDKKHLFSEVVKTFKPVAEGAQPVKEEQKDIQTSVTEELTWIKPILSKAIDVGHQIDLANTEATAHVVLEDDNTPLLSDVPATSLLRLEHELKNLHDFLLTVPTLDPAKGFVKDHNRGAGYYKARPVESVRTSKQFKPVTMVPATDKHPAQVKELFEDVPTGTLETLEWSSLITPAAKADLLDRCDKLTRAVHKARARANEQEVDVDGQKIGNKLLDYVFQPVLEDAKK